jgi:hypothetical protein
MSLQGGFLLFPTTLPGTARHTVPDAERVGGQVRAEHHIVPTLAPYASAVCTFGSAVSNSLLCLVE